MENNLELNNQAKEALRLSAKWSMFLAILGFIGVGFMALAGLIFSFSGVMTSTFSSTLNPAFGFYKYFGLFYILFAVLYYFPIYYFYKYAKQSKEALLYNDSKLLAEGLTNLMKHHKYLGIMALVIISIYILVFIFGIVAFAFAMR